jgi:hypothetical protein
MNRAQLTAAFTADIANIAEVDASAVIQVRLDCDASVSVVLTPAAPATAKPSLRTFSHHFAMTEALQGTRVAFTLQAGDNTDATKKRLETKMADAKTISFPSTDLVVRTKCADCPTVGSAGKAVSQATQQKVNVNARCDPVAFMQVVSSCSIDNWGTLTDAQVQTQTQAKCAAGSACGTALAALGDNIKYCEGSADMLSLFTIMCIKNDAGESCAQYYRQSDASKACSSKTSQSTCQSDSRCYYESNSGYGNCQEAVTQARLSGLCGKCGTAIIQAAASKGSDSSNFELMCVKAGDTYCAPLQQKASSAATPAPSSTKVKRHMDDLCGNSLDARCSKLMMQASATVSDRRAEAAAESCVGPQCSQLLAQSKRQRLQADFMLSEGCKKSETGEYCLELGDALGDSTNVMSCYSAIVTTGYCPASADGSNGTTCTKVLGDAIANLGCCAGVVQRSMTLENSAQVQDTLSATTSAPTPVGLNVLAPCVINIEMITSSNECAKVPQKVHKKRLGLKLSCEDLTQEVKDALAQKIPEDLSAALGVAKDAITNVDPKCSGDITVTVADAPASTDASTPATSAPATVNATKQRRFRTLGTTSGVAVDYQLKSTNDAETERASAEMDRKVQNGELVLPSTQTAVTTVCTTCASLEIDKSSSKTLEVVDEDSAMSIRLGMLIPALVLLIMFL